MQESPIHWNRCLELVNGKVDLAKELLMLFMKDLPKSQQEIHLAIQEKNYSQLSQQIHKLFGACCYCAVPFLTESLEQLNEAVKTNQTKKIPTLCNALDKHIELVQKEYERLTQMKVLK